MYALRDKALTTCKEGTQAEIISSLGMDSQEGQAVGAWVPQPCSHQVVPIFFKEM